MKSIPKIAKTFVPITALFGFVTSGFGNYENTKDVSTELNAGLPAVDRLEAQLNKARNNHATLAERRNQLVNDVRNLKKELIEIRVESVELPQSELLLNNASPNLGIEIEKERISKLAFLGKEDITETPKFKSELFKMGKLIYSDDFDGELNREYWGQAKSTTAGNRRRQDQGSKNRHCPEDCSGHS